MSIADYYHMRHREIAMREQAMRADCDVPRFDPVTQPAHYKRFTIDPVTFAEANGLTFSEANVVKYVCRAPHKGVELEDLRKARRYIDILIEIADRKRRIAAGESAEDVWKIML
jgi:hypothetical protein